MQKPYQTGRVSYPLPHLKRDKNLKLNTKKRSLEPEQESTGSGKEGAAPAGPPPKRQQRSGEDAFPKDTKSFPALLEEELQQDAHPPLRASTKKT